jgi:hypothetical protein
MRLHLLGCLLLCYHLTESSTMRQCCILACQSIALVDLDGDHTLGVRHLHCGIDNMDDRHKFQDERPPEDVVVPDIEASHLKHQHLLALIVSCSIGYLQIDAPNRSRRLS